MKTIFTSDLALWSRISFLGTLKSVLILFILFVSFQASAQSQFSTTGSGAYGRGQAIPAIPAANIVGPLKAFANGNNIVITSTVATDQQPTITYSIGNNTSGASIVSQGTFQYNSATGTGTQTITVNPGTSKGSFNILSTVTTAGGTSTSSKSVTVQNAQ